MLVDDAAAAALLKEPNQNQQQQQRRQPKQPKQPQQPPQPQQQQPQQPQQQVRRVNIKDFLKRTAAPDSPPLATAPAVPAAKNGQKSTTPPKSATPTEAPASVPTPAAASASSGSMRQSRSSGASGSTSSRSSGSSGGALATSDSPAESRAADVPTAAGSSRSAGASSSAASPPAIPEHVPLVPEASPPRDISVHQWTTLGTAHKRRGDEITKKHPKSPTRELNAAIHYVASLLCFISAYSTTDADTHSSMASDTFVKHVDSLTSMLEHTISLAKKSGLLPFASLLMRCEAALLFRATVHRHSSIQLLNREIDGLKQMSTEPEPALSASELAEQIKIKSKAIYGHQAKITSATLRADRRLRDAEACCPTFYAMFRDYFVTSPIAVGVPLSTIVRLARQCFLGYLRVGLPSATFDLYRPAMSQLPFP